MIVSRRDWVFGAFSLPALAQKKPPERPNVVLMLTSGLPAWAVGAYGNKEIRTPHIDRLCQMGTRFTHHIAAAPVAGVNRGTLLTGRTPMQLGDAERLAPNEVALEKLLADQGCATQASDVAGALTFLDSPPAGKPFLLTVNLSPLEAPYNGVARKFLDQYAQTRFDTFSPERAAANAVKGKDMLADPVASLRKAAAAISSVDDEIGTVVARLLQRKLLDKTLLVVTSASGDLLSHHGLWGGGDASDPVNMYEEAIATPMIWVWPGRVPAQAARPEQVSSYDFVPSVCEALSIAPPGRNLCGRSYLLLVTGKPLPKKEPWRSTVFGYHRGVGMARVQRYKLVLRESSKGQSELYAIISDPGEKTNRYDSPEFVNVRDSLTAEYNAWTKRYSS